ncbi:hypothetical protein WJX72_008282 [[Myrmecia] bisecta]|uniref:Protein ApaG n=1 Tax=[Myrmecia] bisecta TaxID=41462 RepID=A0AAW1PY52_9CHLO
MQLRVTLQGQTAGAPKLEAALAAAVAEQRFQDAAALRDKLRQLRPSKIPTTSNAWTQGVCVQVSSYFLPQQSSPRTGSYIFAYRITITNEGQVPVKLLSRHWMIADGNGHMEEVKGPGVVGQFPLLRPGESFQYTSAAPLKTPQGYMEGTFEMVTFTASGARGEHFQAQVARFGLDTDAGCMPAKQHGR